MPKRRAARQSSEQLSIDPLYPKPAKNGRKTGSLDIRRRAGFS
jgi:hypothetical protein